MASLNEILSLDKVTASVKKVDIFMSKCVKNSLEYITALCYKADIFVELGKINDALKLLYSYIPEFNKIEDQCNVLICDEIIKICMNYERYDQVSKFIAIKKNYLPISQMSKFLKDQIDLYLAINDIAKAKELILKYIEDDITKEEEMEAKRSLSKIYFSNREYDNYLELLETLEGYYKDNLMLDEIILSEFNKIQIDYDGGKYPQVIISANAFLKENSDNIRYSLLTASLLIKSYVKCNDIKKASVIESEYRDLATEAYLEEAIEFSYAALDLYNKTNSFISIKDYHDKIDELNALRKPIKKEEARIKKTKEVKEEIIIPLIQINEKSEEPIYRGILNPEEPKIRTTQEIKKKTGKMEITLSSDYPKYEKIFDVISELGPDAKFREIYRQFMIELCKVYKIEEGYVLYYNQKFKGLHYKVERAYDKNIDIERIEKTLNYASYTNDVEAFLDPNDKTYSKNIVTSDFFLDDMYGYAMPLHVEKGVIASIAFFSHEYFLDDTNAYEMLKLITSVLNVRLLMDIKQTEFEFNNKMNFFVIDNMSSGIKEEVNGYIHFNTQALDILDGVNDMSIDDYIYLIDPNNRPEYKSIHESLKKDRVNKTINYYLNINDRRIYIKESFYPLIHNDDLVIFSMIDDITSEIEEKKKLVEIAYQNPVSKVDTEVKLTVDLTALENEEHLAISVFEVYDFKLYEDLYGVNFTNQLIYAMGLKLKDAIEFKKDVNLYHLDRDRFVLLFKGISDKRVVTTRLNEIFDKASKDLESLNKRLKISFEAGCYRKGKTDIVDNIMDYISNALDALNDARGMTDGVHHIAFYNSNLSKERFKENNLVTTISEGIDKGLIALNYQQIVNLENLNIYAYVTKLTLDSYEIEYDKMFEVIKRKNLVKEMDKYLINRSFVELKMIKDELKGLFVLFIPLNYETFDDSLVSYLKKQVNFYKINPKYVVLLSDKLNPKYIDVLSGLGFKLASRNLFDVYSSKCNYLFFDYHTYGVESLLDANKICMKNNTQLIMDKINKKDDILFAKNNNNFIVYGDYYKKLKRVNEIIYGNKK